MGYLHAFLTDWDWGPNVNGALKQSQHILQEGHASRLLSAGDCVECIEVLRARNFAALNAMPRQGAGCCSCVAQRTDFEVLIRYDDGTDCWLLMVCPEATPLSVP